MKLRGWLCQALFFAKIDRPDCEHCNALWRCRGFEMRQRLEELRKQEPGRDRLSKPAK